MYNKLSCNTVPQEPTRHGALKRVLVRHEDMQSPLMFMNEVYVDPGEDVIRHSHVDMEEVFYFLEGTGIMQIEEETYSVAPGDRFIMPARVEHYLKNTGQTPMRFICFGVKETQHLQTLFKNTLHSQG
jgi:mannose-6-phosphate isomerase-like protein (cupin superfamily)